MAVSGPVQIPSAFLVVHPYLLAGWDPEHGTGTIRTSAILISNAYDPSTKTYTQYSNDDNYATDDGLSSACGAEFAAHHLRVSLEIRYLRWKDPLFSANESNGLYLLVPQNEVQVLLGVSFR
jgi:hypothetical protein